MSRLRIGVIGCGNISATYLRNAALFPQLELRDIASFGGWKDVQAKHFADGGIFDQIYIAK